eukprot:sb/3467386/
MSAERLLLTPNGHADYSSLSPSPPLTQQDYTAISNNGHNRVAFGPTKYFNDGSQESISDCLSHVERLPTTNAARNKLLLASAICLLFTIAEALGGYFSNSLAIFTDASHMTIDFVSYTISIVAIWIAKQPPTKRMTFAWLRAEVIGAVLSVFTIWVITGVLIYLAIGRLFNPDYDLEPTPMLITAILGVCVNAVMGWILMPEDIMTCNAPSPEQGAPRVNINVRAAFIHVVGDFIQSIGVLVAAIIIRIKPDWKIVDPICTFLFAILVLFTTINILKDALSVLMEGTYILTLYTGRYR